MNNSDLSGSTRAAVRLATIMVVTVLAGVTTVQCINVSQLGLSGSQTWRALAFVAVTVLIQSYNSMPGARRRPTVLTGALLTLQAVSTFFPSFEFGINWGGMGGLLLASILLLIPSPLSWILSLVGLVLILAEPIRAGLAVGDLAYLLVANILTTLTVYSVTQLAGLVRQLHEARQDLAVLAVEQERTRFSRDLHDLLGYSLSAITLKGELAYRLIRVDPDAAQANLEAILGVSRQALADVRSVARSYRDLSLAAQTTSASTMLESAGITVELSVQDARLPTDVDTVLATVVREGVTNLLRHSKAEHCWITFSRKAADAVLVLSNDGLPEDFPASRLQTDGDGMGGLSNLRSRMESVNGSLVASVDPPGRFTLTASVPVEPSSGGMFRSLRRAQGAAGDDAVVGAKP